METMETLPPRHKLVLIAAIVLVLACALISVALPLATYTIALAMFGLAHVITELRYVDGRFNSRLGNNLRLGMIWLLLLIVSFRTCFMLGLISSLQIAPLELTCVACLAGLVVPKLALRSWLWGAFGIAVVAGVTAGIAIAPAMLLLVFSILHNLTPVGFIAERLRGERRQRALCCCLLVFVTIPLLILSGLPHAALAKLHLLSPSVSLLKAGSLSSHLGVFVPPELHGEAMGDRAFSAAVFLQCMHYAVVLGVLPHWDDAASWAKARTFFPWQRGWLFRGTVAILGTLLFVAFTQSFTGTRSVYSLVAAIHAWLEIPILLLAIVCPAETGFIEVKAVGR